MPLKAPENATDLSAPLREIGLLPEYACVLSWHETEPMRAVVVHGYVEFHARGLLHEDLAALPKFAATDILANVAERTARDLVKHIAEWLPMRAVRGRKEVRGLAHAVYELMRALEACPAQSPNDYRFKETALEKARAALMDFDRDER